MMNRRTFIAGAAAAIAAPARAQSTFLNGELNYSEGTFDWTNGGGDPLQSRFREDGFRQALAISRLNLTSETQRLIRDTILYKPSQTVDLAYVYEGKVAGDVMVSGNGWLAMRPRVLTSRWTRRPTTASWWAVTNESSGERWEIIIPRICSNLVITRLGQATPCVCVPSEGDACF